MYFFKKVRWEGKGTLAGDSVTLKYHYTKNRPGGRGDGIMHLKVKGDKMRGKWVEASKKRSGKISLERK